MNKLVLLFGLTLSPSALASHSATLVCPRGYTMQTVVDHRTNTEDQQCVDAYGHVVDPVVIADNDYRPREREVVYVQDRRPDVVVVQDRRPDMVVVQQRTPVRRTSTGTRVTGAVAVGGRNSSVGVVFDVPVNPPHQHTTVRRPATQPCNNTRRVVRR